jgi:hypothetical protein
MAKGFWGWLFAKRGFTHPKNDCFFFFKLCSNVAKTN